MYEVGQVVGFVVIIILAALSLTKGTLLLLDKERRVWKVIVSIIFILIGLVLMLGIIGQLVNTVYKIY